MRGVSVFRRQKRPRAKVVNSIHIESAETVMAGGGEAGTRLKYDINDILPLNVGGQRFDTRLGTLLADRSGEMFAHFCVLLESDLTINKLPPQDHEGNFFLDRDPEHFRTLLNNLRFLVSLQKQGKSTICTNGCLDDTEDAKSNKSSTGILSRFYKKS